MQSSTANHYFTEDLSDNLFYEDEEENYSRGNVNGDYEIESNIKWNSRFPIGMKNGLTGLEIKGRVRTLSPVLFGQTNTQYLIMSNNELKYLPPGE